MGAFFLYIYFSTFSMKKWNPCEVQYTCMSFLPLLAAHQFLKCLKAMGWHFMTSLSLSSTLLAMVYFGLINNRNISAPGWKSFRNRMTKKKNDPPPKIKQKKPQINREILCTNESLTAHMTWYFSQYDGHNLCAWAALWDWSIINYTKLCSSYLLKQH